MVAETLPGYRYCSLRHRLFEAEQAKGPYPVPGHIQARADTAPSRFALDDLEGQAGTGQRPSSRQTCDSRSDNEDTRLGRHPSPR